MNFCCYRCYNFSDKNRTSHRCPYFSSRFFSLTSASPEVLCSGLTQLELKSLGTYPVVASFFSFGQCTCYLGSFSQACHFVTMLCIRQTRDVCWLFRPVVRSFAEPPQAPGVRKLCCCFVDRPFPL
jgi:hypothetical protein